MNRDDVRMIERGGGARFPREAPHTPRVSSKFWWQQLDRHLSPQPRVLGEVYFSHPACAQQRLHLIVTDPSPDLRWNDPRGDTAGQHFRDGRGQKTSGLRVCRQERGDFSKQFLIVSASLIEEGRAPARLKLQGSVIEFSYLLPSLGLHLAPPARSSRWSQARAKLHSRRTVRGETLRTSAVSSSLSPPKKRSSTIRLLRGSMVDSCSSASSRAINSADRSTDIASASSNETCRAPPPCLA